MDNCFVAKSILKIRHFLHFVFMHDNSNRQFIDEISIVDS